MSTLFVLREAGVGGQVHCIIGPTDFDDAYETVLPLKAGSFDRFNVNSMWEWMRKNSLIVCADDMSGPSSIATQR